MDVDTIHNKILKNMDTISTIVETAKNTQFDAISRELAEECGKKILVIESRLHASLNKYFLLCINSLNRHFNKTAASEEYMRVLSRYNIFNEIDRQIKDINDMLNYINKIPPNNRTGIDSNICVIKCKLISMKNEVFFVNNDSQTDICCGMNMTILNDTGEFICQNCRQVRKIDCMVFKNDQLNDGYKTKHGTYDSMRHYKFWIEHIQGKENQTFDDTFLKKLKVSLAKIQPNSRLVNCEQIRTALKDPLVKETNQNEHASLLLKLIGGTPCPTLTHDENMIINHAFLRVMYIYDTLQLNTKNKPYYPYFIYKIIESRFWQSMKLVILNYIHLQGKATTIKNDNIFKKICEKADPADKLVYRATNHSENLIQIEKLKRENPS